MGTETTMKRKAVKQMKTKWFMLCLTNEIGADKCTIFKMNTRGEYSHSNCAEALHSRMSIMKSTNVPFTPL